MQESVFREVENRDEELIGALCRVWERSVRATHTFLSETAIASIAADLPAFIAQVPRLVVAEDPGGSPLAFLGVKDRKIEMLFVDPAVRGCGLGRRLIEFGFDDYAVDEVCVNEQNPQALGFYEHLGFRIFRRSERDEQGNLFSLLYLRLDRTE